MNKYTEENNTLTHGHQQVRYELKGDSKQHLNGTDRIN